MDLTTEHQDAAVKPLAQQIAPLRRAIDGRVVGDAQRRLHFSPYPELRSLLCDFSEGVLILRGHVASYFLKQVAQETVRSVPGVELIINVVDVNRHPKPRTPGGTVRRHS